MLQPVGGQAKEKSVIDTMYGGLHPGSALLYVVPRSSPCILVTKEVLAKIGVFLECHIFMKSSGGSSTNIQTLTS